MMMHAQYPLPVYYSQVTLTIGANGLGQQYFTPANNERYLDSKTGYIWLLHSRDCIRQYL